jgi:hypothetical protein
MREMMSSRLTKRLVLAVSLLVLCIHAGCDFPITPANVGSQDFQTTQVRYVNLTNMPSDSTNKHILQARFILYSASTRTTSSTVVTTQTVTSLGVSDFFTPLADTGRVSVSVTSGMNVNRPSFPELIQTFKSRNATYTIVGLPPRAGSMEVLDTLLVITSLPPDNSANAVNIRFINCVNDATKTYSFTLGCPSGTPVGSRLGYRASSGLQQIALNGNTLSVALTEQALPDSSTAPAPASVQKGLFNLSSLAIRNNYTVLLYKDARDSIRLLALNDRTSDKINVTPATQPSTYIRVANFSGAALDSVTLGSKGIAQTLGNNSVSGFAMQAACASVDRDTLIVRRQIGLLQQSLSTSLDVNGSQTVFLSDSLAVAAPALTVQPSMGNITLRVVNLTFVPSSTTSHSVSVLRGVSKQARTQSIVGNLPSGQVSPPVTLSREDIVPLIVFNDKQPQSIEQFGFAVPNPNIQAYFLVVTKKQLFLVPDVSSASPAAANPPAALEQGALVQAIQVLSDATTATVQMSLGQVFSDAVGYGASQMTVLPSGMQNFAIGSKTEARNLENGKHVTVVGLGATTASQVLITDGLWSTPNTALYPSLLIMSPKSPRGSFRYLNATNDVDALKVNSDTEEVFNVTTALGQKVFTDPVRIFTNNLTQTITFLGNSNEKLLEARNLTFSLGRGYTIIFAGQKDKSYNVVLMPEF